MTDPEKTFLTTGKTRTTFREDDDVVERKQRDSRNSGQTPSMGGDDAVDVDERDASFDDLKESIHSLSWNRREEDCERVKVPPEIERLKTSSSSSSTLLDDFETRPERTRERKRQKWKYYVSLIQGMDIT